MIDVTKLETVRANKIVVGESYTVRIHGHEPVVMVCTKKPIRSLAKMTPRDAYVFQNGEDTVRFKTHGTAGPQFLVTKVTGVRGGKTNARVTFYTLPKVTARRGRKAKVEATTEQAAA